jgi:replicative DNA helicase
MLGASSTVNSWSIGSERTLLCAALTESRSDVIREIGAQLMATDFYEETHQNLWRCRTSLADAGVAHDMAAVMDSATKLNLFLGGSDYVLGLISDETLKVSSDLALKSAAKRVKDYSILRVFTETLKTATQLSESGTQSHEDLIGFVSDSIENIRSSNSIRGSGPMHIMHYVAAVTEQVEMRLNGEMPQNTVTTGFSELDQLITGFAEGDLIVLAARPSMGKTAISLALGQAAADHGARDVLYFSTEQGGNQLAYRLISSNARIDGTALKRAELSTGDFDRMIEGASKVAGLRLHVDETSEITGPEIRARSRIFAQKHTKPMIVIDYLQRLKPHRLADLRLIIRENTSSFKNLAKELKCPVILLAQLNRDVEKRTNKRPMMSDLGESGAIEQDADIIMFIYRDDYYNPDSKEPGVTELITAKNRDGAIGQIKLLFEKRTQHYSEMVSYEH